MQVFINECSLNKQYSNSYSFIDGMKEFISTLKILSDIDGITEIYRSKYFFDHRGVNGDHFQTSLKSNQQVNNLFFQNWQRVNPKIWEDTRIHCSTNTYVYQNADYCNFSIAELSERLYSNSELSGLLLNFLDSGIFDFDNIDVCRNEVDNINLSCLCESSNLHNWLCEKGFINVAEQYDENSNFAPNDIQTVLRNKDIFELTNFPYNNGRKVYRRKDTSELWVVDGSRRHAGPGAHCEVFDENSREHLGTSLYSEINIKIEFRKDNRKISLT